MKYKEWREGLRVQVFRRRMEGCSGCTWHLWRSMEWWRLVCDCVLWHFLSKNKIGPEFRVSVRVNSVLGCTGSCGDQSQKTALKKETGVQWRHNYSLIMTLKSATQCSSMRTIPIIYDDVVIMRPSDLIGWDNIGKKRLDWVKTSSDEQRPTSTHKQK